MFLGFFLILPIYKFFIIISSHFIHSFFLPFFLNFVVIEFIFII